MWNKGERPDEQRNQNVGKTGKAMTLAHFPQCWAKGISGDAIPYNTPCCLEITLVGGMVDDTLKQPQGTWAGWTAG